MKNQIQQFHNKEFGSLEILMIEGKPYFPATECAEKLGYKNPRKAIIDHCRCVTKRDTPHPQNSAKTMERSFIPEGDLYRLIIRSKLPAAERFERWVFDEVLPTIRKYGAYMVDEILDAVEKSQDFALELFETLQAEKGKTSALLNKLDALAPKALYCDIILRSEDAVPISVIAKDYGMSAIAFNRLLYGLGIQYRVGGTWLLYQRYANKGYTKSHTYYTGRGTVVINTYWTQKGRFFLYETLLRKGIVPLMESGCEAIN